MRRGRRDGDRRSGRRSCARRSASQQTRPGATITDRVAVTGIGVLSVPVRGPALGSVRDARRDRVHGHARSGRARSRDRRRHVHDRAGAGRAGRLLHLPGVDRCEPGDHRGHDDLCRGRRDDVRPGGADRDDARVAARSAPRLVALRSHPRDRPRPHAGQRSIVELFGPFGSRAAIRCSGDAATGAGACTRTATASSGRRRVRCRRVGLYTFRERIAAADLATRDRVRARGGDGAGVGRDRHRTRRPRPASPSPRERRRRDADRACGSRPLGIDAPIAAVAIDIARRRCSAARRGHPPHGLVARRDGAGRDAGRGADRRPRRQREGGARRVLPAPRGAPRRRGSRSPTARPDVRLSRRLGSHATERPTCPASVYTRNGPARLVLVTCGGPFEPPPGHYRDNVVVDRRARRCRLAGEQLVVGRCGGEPRHDHPPRVERRQRLGAFTSRGGDVASGTRIRGLASTDGRGPVARRDPPASRVRAREGTAAQRPGPPARPRAPRDDEGEGCTPEREGRDHVRADDEHDVDDEGT